MLEIEYAKEIKKLQVQLKDLQGQVNTLARNNAELDWELHNATVEIAEMKEMIETMQETKKEEKHGQANRKSKA